jgi:hypothetical protein
VRSGHEAGLTEEARERIRDHLKTGLDRKFSCLRTTSLVRASCLPGEFQR